LLSKVITLTALSILENVAFVIFVYGFDFKPLLLVLGISLSAAIFCLFGFIAVARYDSINEYLFPSVLYTAVLSLVFLNYFGLWESWLFYLHPLQAPLLLLQNAFNPLKNWQVIYGLLYSALSLGLIFLLSQKMFYRFIIKKEGVR
ncbi:ABC transporter permease, partial [candidate division KSB1 bacterium]|nr:ABC transporter permease [candidate division KSB1 bacterium]